MGMENGQARRIKRRQAELEVIFQANKGEILEQLNDLDNGILELAKSWDVGERTMRRWAERLGIDTVERQNARNGHLSKLRGAAKRQANPKKAKPRDEDTPQAHKLIGLW